MAVNKKKDFGNVLNSISPAAAMLDKAGAIPQSESVTQAMQNIGKVKGKMGAPKKAAGDKKTEFVKIYFSPNELEIIQEAGISTGEMTSLLRMKLKEMGANIGLK